MEMQKLKAALLEKLREYQDAAFALSDAMAREPEIGGQEYKSSAAIVKLLRDSGMEVEYPFAGLETAFRGRICPERPRRVALLAEYDALRGQGHACGHCASGSSSVLAALALHALRDSYDFGVDIIGTPDEEFAGQKAAMADQGIFDGYDFAAMVHMGPSTAAGASYIALDGLGIKWHGAPAHAAAAPWTGRNAFNAARLFFDAVDMMRQHLLPEARLHGIIKEAGTASNIVPDLAEVEFLTRAPGAGTWTTSPPGSRTAPRPPPWPPARRWRSSPSAPPSASCTSATWRSGRWSAAWTSWAWTTCQRGM